MQQILAGGGFGIVNNGVLNASGYSFGTFSNASMKFKSNGDIEKTEDSAPSDAGDWGVPNTPGQGAFYWIRATLVSGNIPGGTLNTWLQLNSDRQWSLSVSAPPFSFTSQSCVLTVEIATDAGGANIVETCTVTLDCTAEGNV